MAMLQMLCLREESKWTPGKARQGNDRATEGYDKMSSWKPPCSTGVCQDNRTASQWKVKAQIGGSHRVHDDELRNALYINKYKINR